jgi:nitroreductase
MNKGEVVVGLKHGFKSRWDHHPELAWREPLNAAIRAISDFLLLCLAYAARALFIDCVWINPLKRSSLIVRLRSPEILH